MSHACEVVDVKKAFIRCGQIEQKWFEIQNMLIILI